MATKMNADHRRLGVSKSVAHRFLSNAQEFLLNRGWQAFFRDTSRMKITAQSPRNIGTLDHFLQRLDQSGFLDNCRLKTERGTTGLSESELRHIGRPLNVTKDAAGSCVDNLPRCPKLHGDSGEKLSERVVNLSDQLIPFLKHCGLSGSLRQSGQLNRQTGLACQCASNFDFLWTEFSIIRKSKGQTTYNLFGYN